MKKVSSPYSRKFSPLRLYRDDVDQLLAIFERNGEQVAITVGDYQLSGTADFDELKRRIVSSSVTYFKITTTKHACPQCPSSYEWLTLTLAKDGGRLHVSDEADTQLLGMAHQVEAFLKSRRSFISYAASLKVAYTVIWTWNIVYFLVNFSATMSSIGHLLRSGFQGGSLYFAGPLDVIGGLLPTVLILFYLSWATYTSAFRHCIVYLEERSAMPGFFRRNRDQIIVGVVVGTVCAVIGAVVGAVITLMLTSPQH